MGAQCSKHARTSQPDGSPDRHESSPHTGRPDALQNTKKKQTYFYINRPRPGRQELTHQGPITAGTPPATGAPTRDCLVTQKLRLSTRAHLESPRTKVPCNVPSRYILSQCGAPSSRAVVHSCGTFGPASAPSPRRKVRSGHSRLPTATERFLVGRRWVAGRHGC